MQLWTVSKLNRLPFSLLRDLYFYAPLTDSLDFWGIDPVTYTRAETMIVAHRGGSKTIAANVPPFEYDGELPLGLYLNSPASLQFSPQNTLDDADTLIWFESGVPKSTPTNANPINGSGVWTGNLDIYLKHLLKARRTLANSEITQIQTYLEDIAQVIPDLPAAPTSPVGSPITEVPAHVGGAVYELSQDPDLGSLAIFSHGGLYITRVASGPGQLEYTAGGTGNRTITMGLAPIPAGNIVAQYFVAGP